MGKNFVIFTAASLFALCAGYGSDPVKEEAVSDAEDQGPEVRLAYLECYALVPDEKKACLDKLNAVYVKEEKSSDSAYVKEFAYEAEKLGFFEFLKENGLNPKKIDDGPLYDPGAEAYKVVCGDGETYYMKFDYKKRKWETVNPKPRP